MGKGLHQRNIARKRHANSIHHHETICRSQLANPRRSDPRDRCVELGMLKPSELPAESSLPWLSCVSWVSTELYAALGDNRSHGGYATCRDSSRGATDDGATDGGATDGGATHDGPAACLRATHARGGAYVPDHDTGPTDSSRVQHTPLICLSSHTRSVARLC
jgi:hypothetical protein